MPQTTKSLKTPLRYPGGKSRALSKLLQYVPDLRGYREYREPFLGGGSVALEISKRYRHLDVWVNDLYEPLYNFWKELQHDGKRLQDILTELKYRHPDPVSAKKLFLDAKEYLTNPGVTGSFPPYTESVWRGVAFYVVNKCSFSGLSESSSFSEQASESNFSLNGISKLYDYSVLIGNWKITNLSYEELLTDDKECFTYLDPPYEIGSNLYGRRGSMHKGFDHDTFAVDCDCFVGPQLVSYNSSQLIRDRFEGWTAAEFAHTYTMRSVGSYNTDQASRKELVLLNYES
jgi:DNA adenine methylase